MSPLLRPLPLRLLLTAALARALPAVAAIPMLLRPPTLVARVLAMFPTTPAAVI